MEKREQILRRVVFKCADFARQLAYHRAFMIIPIKRLNFWIYLSNNTLDISILDWTHLFGNYKDNLHWKKVIKDNNAFKTGLLKYLNYSEDQWKDYHTCVKEY